MAMLDTVSAGLGQGCIKGVPYMTMEICISIDTGEYIITLIHAAYVTKVIIKPAYIIMAKEIRFFGVKERV